MSRAEQANKAMKVGRAFFRLHGRSPLTGKLVSSAEPQPTAARAGDDTAEAADSKLPASASPSEAGQSPESSPSA